MVGLFVELGRRSPGTLPEVMVAAAAPARAGPGGAAPGHPVRADHRGRARADRGRPAGRAAGHRGDPPAVHRAVGGGRRAGRGGGAGRRAVPAARWCWRTCPARSWPTTPRGSGRICCWMAGRRTRGGSHPAGPHRLRPDSGWLVTMVGARGQDWGRLLLRWLPVGAEPDPPTRLTDPGRAGRLHAGAGPADPPRRRGPGAPDPPYGADRAARPHPAGGRGGGAGQGAGGTAGAPAAWSASWFGTGQDPEVPLGPRDRPGPAAGPGRGGLAGAARGGRCRAWPARWTTSRSVRCWRCARRGRGDGAARVRHGAAPDPAGRADRGRSRGGLAPRGAPLADGGAAGGRRRPPRPPRGTGVPAAARGPGRAAAPAARRAPVADLRRAGTRGRCWPTTRSTRASSCSARCGPTWRPGATSRRRRVLAHLSRPAFYERLARHRPGAATSTWTRWRPACRCTWRCSRSTRSGIRKQYRAATLT